MALLKKVDLLKRTIDKGDYTLFWNNWDAKGVGGHNPVARGKTTLGPGAAVSV